MKKVLILSYFFPPCKFTAASRISSWVNYFPELGYKPYVITRNWDNQAKSYKALAEDSGTENTIIATENSQIHYLSFEGNLRDSLFTTYGENKFSLVRKFLSLVEIVLQNYMFYHPIYRKMYKEAAAVIKKENIDKIIVSANPFIQFHIAYKLKKKFPQVNWIADYRDDWTTTELISKRNFLQKLVHNLEILSEKKWLSNAHSFTSISSYYVNKISRLINKNGTVVLNGFNDDVTPVEQVNYNDNEFLITYNGTLYNTQPVEDFLDALIELINTYEDRIFIKVNFIGLALDPAQVKRVKSKTKSIENHILITERVPKQDVLDYQIKSNLLLMLAHKNLKGISSSKLYEYIGLHKETLLYPNDNDILEQTLNDVSLGLIANSKSEIVKIISAKIDAFIKNPNESVQVDDEIINKYSRNYQAKELVKLLNSI